MMRFVIGQKVVCTNGSFGPAVGKLAKRFPIKGCTHTIRGIFHDVPHYLSGKSEAAVLLAEIVNPPMDSFGGEFGWSTSRFRPLMDEKEASEENEQTVCDEELLEPCNVGTY
jgi:hypothetical protein